MVKKALVSPAHPRCAKTRPFPRRGRSERKDVTRCISEATGTQDVEALSDARTKLEAFFNILQATTSH